MKQTAVEFLVSHLTEYGFNLKLHKIEIKQAKEMEKQQKGYSEEEVINLVDTILQHSDKVIDAITNENTHWDAQSLIEITKKNKMKQTAVEWLAEQFEKTVFYSEEAKENTIEQAKEMEKQQIIDACDIDKRSYDNAEQYYNETYNK